MSEKDEMLMRHLGNKQKAGKLPKHLDLTTLKEIQKVTELDPQRIKQLWKEDPSMFDLDQRLRTPVGEMKWSGKPIVSPETMRKIEQSRMPAIFGGSGQVTVGSMQTLNLQKPNPDTMLGKHFSKSTGGRVGIGMGIGAAVGLAGVLFDGTNDDLSSAIKETTVAAGLGIVGSFAADGLMMGSEWGRGVLYEHNVKGFNLKPYEEFLQTIESGNGPKITAGIAGRAIDAEAADNLAHNVRSRPITISQMTAEQIRNGEALLSDEALAARTNKHMKRLAGWKGAGIAALGTIGLASLLDIGNELDEQTKTERMLAEQENNLVRQQNAERRALRKMGYGDIDMGQIAIDMFNQRIGHHKMGNAKFE